MSDPLAEETCRGAEIPGDFYLQDEGAFSDENLHEPGTGIEAGFYEFWRERAEDPPFDEPPLDVVCQVLVFGDAKAARAYVAGLEEEPAGVLGVFREPDVFEGRVDPFARNGDARLVTLEAEARGDGPGPLYALVEREGDLVHIVLIDRPMRPLASEEAVALVERLLAGRDDGQR